MEDFKPLRGDLGAMRLTKAGGIVVPGPAFQVRTGTAIYDLANKEAIVAAAAQGFTPVQFLIESASLRFEREPAEPKDRVR